MDGIRFDNLTRRLAATSRRRVLAGLAAGLVGGLTAARADDVEAQRPQGQANGAACGRATECESFNCANGVCCDAPCTGQCETCATGTCTVVTGAPEPGRTPCPGSGPCAAVCDGVEGASCASFPGAEVVCGDATCADGWLTTYTCGSNGTCTPTTTSCAPFGCEAAGIACATGCATDDECGAGNHCDDGTCLPNAELGAACEEDTDCQSGLCVDDVCCAERCGVCETCNVPGSEGFCGPAPDDTPCDGGFCCEGDCVDILASVEHCGNCDNACPGVENGVAVCVEGSCSITCNAGFQPCNGVCIGANYCCTELGPVCCGLYACNPGQATCRTSCVDDSHCIDVEVVSCFESSCVVGDPESKLICFDDVHCPTGMTCVPFIIGICTELPCLNDDECGSGARCIDGMCTFQIRCTNDGDCGAVYLSCIEGICASNVDVCALDNEDMLQAGVDSRRRLLHAPIALGVALRHSPEWVWHALTDERAIAEWAMANDFAPVVGRRYWLRAEERSGAGGLMEGEVVAVEPNRLLAFTWRGGSLAEPTTVTITLEPDGAGTLLSVRHTTPDGSACRAARHLLGKGWEFNRLLRALPRYLDRLEGSV